MWGIDPAERILKVMVLGLSVLGGLILSLGILGALVISLAWF